MENVITKDEYLELTSSLDTFQTFLEQGGNPNTLVINEANYGHAPTRSLLYKIVTEKAHMWRSSPRKDLPFAKYVQLLLEYGVNANYGGIISDNEWQNRDNREQTPLMIATGDITDILLQGVKLIGTSEINRANVNYVAARWGTALHYAVFHRDNDKIATLLKYDADPTIEAWTIRPGVAGRGASSQFRNYQRLYFKSPLESALAFGFQASYQLMDNYMKKIREEKALVKPRQMLAFMTSLIEEREPTDNIEDLNNIGKIMSEYIKHNPDVIDRAVIEHRENPFKLTREQREYAEYGYDADGYDIEGYDVNGFDIYGYDIEGYDEDGFDVDGYDANGYDPEGYDVDGYDANGYDPEGYDANGIKKKLGGRYRYRTRRKQRFY
jgi:hypothetical protein